MKSSPPPIKDAGTPVISNYHRNSKQNMSAATCVPVTLLVYDLSRGLARAVSRIFVGKQFDGIWLIFASSLVATPPCTVRIERISD